MIKDSEKKYLKEYGHLYKKAIMYIFWVILIFDFVASRFDFLKTGLNLILYFIFFAITKINIKNDFEWWSSKIATAKYGMNFYFALVASVVLFIKYAVDIFTSFPNMETGGSILFFAALGNLYANIVSTGSF